VPRTSPAVTKKIHVDAIASGLAPREWRIGSEKRARCHAYLLRSGSAEARLPDGTLASSAPGITWLPRDAGVSVRLAAGASGFLLAVDEELLAQTCESNAEGLALAHFARRIVSFGPDDTAAALDDLIAPFSAIEREVRRPQPGSRAVVVAHLGLLLLRLWRLAGAPAAVPAGGPERIRTVDRFLELVDLHFSEHWPIAKYAQALGITEDRLHSVCTKESRRSPLALIHGRLVKEARLRLERSTLPVEKIAARLGFADPAYFSRFFRRQVGTSPAAYRRSAMEQRLSELDTFAAWP